MKNIRRIAIVILLIAIIAMFLYRQLFIKEPPQTISSSNVTVVKAIDQTEAQDNPAFVKEIVKPEMPKGKNVALGMNIKASSFNQTYTAPRAVDGKTDGPSYWEGKSDYPNTLTVDLKKPVKIHTVRLLINPSELWGKRTQTIAVNISSDGKDFTELSPSKQYTFDPITGNEVQVPFDEIEAQYVQIVITENSGAEGGQIAEFEVYSN